MPLFVENVTILPGTDDIIEIIHGLQKNGIQDMFLNRKMKCTQSSGKNKESHRRR